MCISSNNINRHRISSKTVAFSGRIDCAMEGRVVWMYFFTVLLGLGVIVGWFGLLEWDNKRQWERYRREQMGHGRSTDECGPYSKQAPGSKLARSGRDERPGRNDT